jgi:hypothetical protein
MISDKLLDDILKREGGYVNHPNDPGGHTNGGVTFAQFQKFRPGATVAELKTLDRSGFRQFYDWYFTKRGLGRFPVAIQDSVADAMTMHGKWGDLLDDVVRISRCPPGKDLPIALHWAVTFHGAPVIDALICARRCAYVSELSDRNANLRTFIRGWIKRLTEVGTPW